MSAAERKAKKYFKTCMDAESPEKVGSKPFLALLQQVHTLFKIKETKSTCIASCILLQCCLSFDSLSLSFSVCVVRWLGSIRRMESDRF